MAPVAAMNQPTFITTPCQRVRFIVCCDHCGQSVAIGCRAICAKRFRRVQTPRLRPAIGSDICIRAACAGGTVSVSKFEELR